MFEDELIIPSIFYLEFLKISCRTDVVDQDQTTKTVPPDVGFSLSDNFGEYISVKNLTLKWQYLEALFDLFFSRLTLF